MNRGLLVGLLCVGLVGCGSNSTKTVTVAPPNASTSSSASSSASPTVATSSSTSVAPAPTVHLATFKSPSANIGCMIIAGTARCDIRHRTWTPPARPSNCPPVVDYGQGAMIGRSGLGQLVCAGDTTLDPSAHGLAYGSDTVVGRFRCQSRTAGVTCTNGNTGHGFFISIGSYRLF